MRVTLYRPKNRHGNNAIWYAKWLRPDGKYQRESLRTTDRALAKKIKAKLEAGLIEERYTAKQSTDLAPDDAWDEYDALSVKSVEQKHAWWKQFWSFCGHETLGGVRRSDVAAWQKHLLKTDQPVTVNKKIRAMASVYDTIIREELHDGENPFSGREPISEGERKLRAVPWPMVVGLMEIAKADTDMYLVVVLGGLAGMRKGEILNARWEHVAWDKDEIYVAGTKSRASAASVHLHPVLREYLDTYRKDSGYIVRPEKTPGAWRYRWEFKEDWKALKAAAADALDYAPLKSVRLHDLRHSFATRLLDLGYDMKDISKSLRHANTRPTERYADLRGVTVKIGRID